MIVQETFYRPDELEREASCVPAVTYNLARLLLNQSETDCVFVPVRSMQYLAVLDSEEIIFVHREGRRTIEIAWQAFRPQARSSLTDPVPYEVAYYLPSARETMRRLQGEFNKALQVQKGRLPAPRQSQIISIKPG